jgi:hypothetical protein
MQKSAPIFVKVEDYRDVLDMIDLLKQKIHDANGIINNIRQIKAKEDNEIETWQTSLEEVESRVAAIDKTLAEVRNM